MTAPIPSSALQIEARCRTNPYYAKAVGAQPGYTAARELRDAAIQRKRERLYPQVIWPTEPANARGIDKYLADYTAAHAEQEARDRDAQAFDAVTGACERKMGSAVDYPDRLLEILAVDLNKVLTKAAAVVERLGGAGSPTEAIGHDTVPAWRELARSSPWCGDGLGC